MLRACAVVLLCACATAKPAAGPAQGCLHAYELCNNGCFTAPNYKRNGPQCVQTSAWQLCPQENQIVDTVAAGKCFEKCEQQVQVCEGSQETTAPKGS